MQTTTTNQPYACTTDEGVIDLWWPYGPATGRYTIKTSGEQTDGRLLQLLVRETRGAGTPLHIHTDSDETFFLISGTLTVWVGDERFDAGPGDFVLGPKGVPHAFVVTSDTAEFLVTMAGAGTHGRLGYGIAGFFQEVAPLVVDGEEPPAPAVPDPQEFARLMTPYGITPAGPQPSLG